MKKTLFLFLMIVLGAASCKKQSAKPDDEQPGGIEVPTPPEEESRSLPSMVVITNGDLTDTYDFHYIQGTRKLQKITKNNGNSEVYHYEGDLIKRIDFSDVDYKTYIYENNNLVQEIDYRDGMPRDKAEIVHDGNGKLTLHQYAYKDNNWLKENTILIEYDNNGNLKKGNATGISVNMEYDNKNVPGLNITGMNKINFLGGVPMGDRIDFSDMTGRRNNPTKVNITIVGVGSQAINYTYEFGNSNHPKFPTKITGTGDGKSFSAIITYQ